MSGGKKPVPAGEYSEEYFGSVCDGFREFERYAGAEMPERLEKAFALAHIGKNDAVLDVGCGRGELVVRAALAGAKARGIDYSANALKFARRAIRMHGLMGKARVTRADAKKLPFKDGEFTKILFTDVIEHMHDWELEEFMREAGRVLRPGGEIIIETSPNALLAKPLYAVAGLVGLGRGPINRVVHVNEQSWFSMRSLLKRHGFSARVWMEMDAKWFRAAVGQKRGSAFFGVLLRVLENRLVSGALGTMPLSIFFAPRVWARGIKR